MREISLNILDIAQNSISAQASLIQITIEEDTALQRLTVSIEDNGCGMSEEKVKSVTNPFYTTRTTRKVGLGIPFFKMAAEMTGGSFDIASSEGVGTRLSAVFCTGHIDCMPLGDVNSTVCTLIQCNPSIDFVYTYWCDGCAFTADTRRFKEILNGVPIETAEVMAFVRSFLEENTASVRQDALQKSKSPHNQ